MNTEARSPMLSVVTPVLNARDTLEATLRSVLALRGASVEHIVVDGGSTDGTLEYLRTLSYIKLHTQTSSGISGALNEGLQLAQGVFVVALNADDVFLPPMNDVLAQLASNGAIDTIYYSDIEQFDPNTDMAVTRRADIGPIARYMSIYHPGLFVPASVYAAIGGYSMDYDVAMDCEFVHRALARGVCFERLPCVSASMRLRGKSHLDTAGAMREFERSVVAAGLQTPLLARWFRVRQTVFHHLLKYSSVQALWLALRKVLGKDRSAPDDGGGPVG